MQGPEDKEGKDFFLTVPEKLDNPYPDFAYFREKKPIFFYPPMDSWFVFRFHDVEALFMEPRLSSKRMEAFIKATPLPVREEVQGFSNIFDRFVLMRDGEGHASLRKLLFQGFSPRIVSDLKGSITKIADELLTSVMDSEGFDASKEFAHILPVAVISTMLGVPKEDWSHVQGWADDIADFFNALPITVSHAHRLTLSATEMTDYVRHLLAERKDQPREDFLGTLLHAKEDGQGLSEADILSNAIVLLIAGHETTRNLIGNAIYLLLSHPPQLSQLKADSSLYKPVIEETLRYESVHPLMPRIASEDFIYQGHHIRQGQFVHLCIASANRDPSQFSNPNQFDISRKHCKHLAFGAGPHFCLGAPLARLEAHIALERLFSRFPNLRLDDQRNPVWHRIANLRGPKGLPVIG